jgi:hypothetical protein
MTLSGKKNYGDRLADIAGALHWSRVSRVQAKTCKPRPRQEIHVSNLAVKRFSHSSILAELLSKTTDGDIPVTCCKTGQCIESLLWTPMAPATPNSEGGPISPDLVHPFVKAIEMTRRAIYYSKDNQQQVSWNELARRVRDGFDPGLEVCDFSKTNKYKTKCQERLENQKWTWDTEETGQFHYITNKLIS